jgi:cobalt-zinc-cadmium efflux system protein
MTHGAEVPRGNGSGEGFRQGARKRLGVALALTATVMAVQIVGGLYTGSLALLADSGHMATDVGALILSLVAVGMAGKAPSRKHSYGFYRAEVLAALANSVALLGVSGWILVEAARRILKPPDVQTGPMLAVASLGLIANGLAAWLLHRDSAENINVKSAYLETLADVLGSIGVVLAAGIMRLTGWYLADPIVSLCIGGFLIPRTWKIAGEAIHVLLEGKPLELSDTAIVDRMLSSPGVSAVHDLHVWSLTSGVTVLTAHVVLQKGTDCDSVLTSLERLLAAQFGIEHCTLQVEHDDRARQEQTRF